VNGRLSDLDVRLVEYEYRQELEHRRALAGVVCMTVATVLFVFVALVACGASPRGTVTKVTPLPNGSYQLEVIDRPSDANGDTTFELVDAGRSTGCQVGEVWPTCD
jgi:hypothetical protein